MSLNFVGETQQAMRKFNSRWNLIAALARMTSCEISPKSRQKTSSASPSNLIPAECKWIDIFNQLSVFFESLRGHSINSVCKIHFLFVILHLTWRTWDLWRPFFCATQDRFDFSPGPSLKYPWERENAVLSLYIVFKIWCQFQRFRILKLWRS